MDDRFGNSAKEDLIKYLQTGISDKSSIEDIVNVFEEMCKKPVEEDMILFETGTYFFTGEPMFYFSLVRQFPNCEEEYDQIHVDVLYVPEKGNKRFQQCTWNEDIEENIFAYIKKSQEFHYCIAKEFSKVNIYVNET